MGHLPFERRSYTHVVRHPGITPSYGTSPDKRPILEHIRRGVINLNKPKGPTSHMVSDYVQRILDLEKAGHGGTLDPGVTGVLAIALQDATKVVQALLPAGKEYVCVMHLHTDVPVPEITRAFSLFVGKIAQTPPLRSAVKRVEREREIYYLELLEINGRDVLFRVGCQAGTYIRTLCTQMGTAMKSAAHMAELVRTKAGPFTDANWVTLQDIEDAKGYFARDGNETFLRHCIRPMETAIVHLPKIVVFDEIVSRLCNGSPLFLPGVVSYDSDMGKNNLIAVLTGKGELIALAESNMSAQEMGAADHGTVAHMVRVCMIITPVTANYNVRPD